MYFTPFPRSHKNSVRWSRGLRRGGVLERTPAQQRRPVPDMASAEWRQTILHCSKVRFPCFRRWIMANPYVLIKKVLMLLVVAGLFVFVNLGYAQQEQRGQTSYMKVDSGESFASIMARMKAAKPEVEKEHSAVLNERYDLSDNPVRGVTMDRGKPIQEGVRVKLPPGMSWEKLEIGRASCRERV